LSKKKVKLQEPKQPLLFSELFKPKWSPKGPTRYAQIPDEVTHYLLHNSDGGVYLHFYLCSYAYGRTTLITPIQSEDISEELMTSKIAVDRHISLLKKQKAILPVGYNAKIGVIYKIRVPVYSENFWKFVDPEKCSYLIQKNSINGKEGAPGESII